MSNRILNLIFKADTVQAMGAIDDLQGTEGQPGGIQGLVSAVTSIISPAALAAGGLLALGRGVYDAANEYSDYVLEVDNFATAMGITTEEADFLLKTMEEFGIKQAPIEYALKNLASNGLTPTVEGLAGMLAEWDAIPDASEKATEGAEFFGKSGLAELLGWYTRLNPEQRDNLGMLEDYKYTADEAVTAANDYKIAVGELTGEWGEFKEEMLVGVIPVLAQLLGFMVDSKQAIEDFAQTVQDKVVGAFSGGSASGATSAAGGQQMAGAYGLDYTPNSSSNWNPGSINDRHTAFEVKRLVDTLPTTLADVINSSGIGH